MSNLVCRQCGFENDSTRVFCHNCGTRLGAEPTSSPAPASAPIAPGATPAPGKLYIPPTQAEPAVASKPPVKPPTRSRSLDRPARKVSLLRPIISTAILGAALAAIIQMFRPPDGLPPAVAANEAQASQVHQMAESYADSPIPRVLQVTTPQVNNFLAARVVSGDTPDQPAYRPKFVRAFVVPGNGDFRFFIEERLGNWPIEIYLIQYPVASGGAVSFETTGGGIGRLPIHPSLLSVVTRLVDPVLASVSEALASVSNLSGVTITPAGAAISWQAKPAEAPAATP